MSCHRSLSPLRFKSVGRGHPLVLLHGFGMQPRTYFPLARLLADRAQVIIPAIFDLPGMWTFGRALAGLEATLDSLGLEQVSLLGHSFGGGLELGFAAWWPHRTIECVFGDTLGVRERFGRPRRLYTTRWAYWKWPLRQRHLPSSSQ